MNLAELAPGKGHQPYKPSKFLSALPHHRKMKLDKSLASRMKKHLVMQRSRFTTSPSGKQKVRKWQLLLSHVDWSALTMRDGHCGSQVWKCAFSSEEWPMGTEHCHEMSGAVRGTWKLNLCQPSPLFSLYYSWVCHSNPLILITKCGNMETDFNLRLIYYSWRAMKRYGVNLIALQLKYLFLCT